MLCFALRVVTFGYGVSRGGKRSGGDRSAGKGGQELKVIPLPLDPNAVVLGLRPATAYT